MSKDRRFEKTSSDPRFHKSKRDNAKVKLDDRFKSLFEFDNVKKVDKYGKKVKGNHDVKHLKNIYEFDHGDEAEGTRDKPVDFARGEGFLESSSEDDDESEDGDESGVNDSDDDDDQVELQPEKYDDESDEEELNDSEQEELDDDELQTEYKKLDEQAKQYQVNDNDNDDNEIDFTNRLAVTNLDWDHLSAQDLYVALDSILDSVDYKNSLKHVKVYMSNFGKVRIEQEETRGPTLINDTKKGKSKQIDSESALREYQLGRLKYYYAIVTLKDKKTAIKLFHESQNTELERTANIIKFEIVPDDVDFDDDDIRDVANTKSENYKGVDFTTDALRHSKVKLTWDEDDSKRMALTRKKLNQDEIDEQDFKNLVASGSSDEEDEDSGENEKRAALLRAALGNSVNDDVHKVRGGKGIDETGDMEVTFAPGLSEVKANEDEHEEVEMNTLDKYKRKEKERKQAKKDKKEQKRLENEKDNSSNDIENEIKDGDEFFEKDDESREDESKSNANDKKVSTKDELELLMDDEEVEHFDMDDIAKKEKGKNRKRKGNKRDNKELEKEDNFDINVNDERFKGVFEDHEFAIDPTKPNFKPTKNMKKLMAERSRRSQKANIIANSNENNNNDDDNIHNLIKSVKNKSNKRRKI